MEYYFKEGCYIDEILNTPDDPAVSIARVRVLPGTKTLWHRLKGTTERYLVLEGAGLAETGDSDQRVMGPGDTLTILPGTPQRMTNNGSCDLVFLAVCTPRFEEANYIDGRLD